MKKILVIPYNSIVLLLGQIEIRKRRGRGRRKEEEGKRKKNCYYFAALGIEPKASYLLGKPRSDRTFL
jgi:hypothetical protein